VTQTRTRFTAAAALAAIALSAPGSLAQTRKSIVPSLSIAHVYDDNLFADVEGSAGQMLQIRPSLEGSWESPRLTFLSLYSQDMLRSNHSDLNTLDARRHAFVDMKFRSTPMTTFGVSSRYDRSETPGELEFDTGILGPRQVADRWQMAPNFSHRLGPRSVLTGGYDFTLEQEVDTPRGTMHQGRLAISREWTSRTDIVGSYLGRYFNDSFESQTSHALLGGFSREVAAGTQFSFYAGPRVTSYRSGIKPEVSTGFIRDTPRINLALDYWHGETIILGIPGPVAVDSGTARVSWPLTAKLELGALAGVTDIDTIDLREARVYRTGILGSWTTRGMYTVGASYGVDYQEGDIRRRLEEDVLRHVFRVTLTIAPRLSHSLLPPDEAARVKGVAR
jgi:hypothetical protein